MEYKETKEFSRCRRCGDVYTECATDYSLPDYNGDVRRILFTDARVHPSGSFENGDSVDFSGIVTYYMVYTDSENRINSVSFSSDYDFTVKCDGENYDGSFAEIGIASYNMRLLGPRKISARAAVSAGVTIAESLDISPRGSAFESGILPEVECSVVDSLVKRRSSVCEREYAEELMRLDGAICDEVEIIYSDAEYTVDSCTAEEGGAAIRGSLRVFALVKNGDNSPYLAERNIRIDESVAFEGLNSEHRMMPFVEIGSVRTSVTADENGCSIVAGIILELYCESIGNERNTIVTDAYRKDMEVSSAFENFSYSELVTLLSEREEISAILPGESLEIENPRELICLRAQPKLDNVSFDDGVAKLVGEIKYSGIAISDDGEGKVSYHPFKLTAEFEKNVNTNCQNSGNLRILPLITCTSADAKFDDNGIYLTSTAQIKITVIEEMSVKILAESETVADTEIVDRGSKIIVYYPEAGEGLFEIAKKFHTTVEKIIEDNSAAARVMTSDSGQKTVGKLLIF